MNQPADIRRFSTVPGTPSLLLRSALTFRRTGDWPSTLPTAKFLQLHCDADYLRDYHALYGIDLATASPLLTALYPLAQRAQLALLLESEFPFPIPGVVHLGNGLTELAPIDWRAPFDLTVTVNRVPDADNGAQCLNICVQFAQHDQQVAQCDSHYLVRRGQGLMRRERSGRALPSSAQQASWAITLTDIRRYAYVSGDFNPIHLHDFPARLLGAPGVMAHGMYLAGRAAATLQQQTGRPLSALQIGFQKPVLVPTAELICQFDDSSFRLLRDGKPVSSGQYHLRSSD